MTSKEDEDRRAEEALAILSMDENTVRVAVHDSWGRIIGYALSYKTPWMQEDAIKDGK